MLRSGADLTIGAIMNLAAIALCLMLAQADPKTSSDQKRENRRAETADSKKDAAKPDALTPMDQSNKERDVKLTQEIRQAVMAEDRLSFTSKNVKIIAIEGLVTLRGEVPSKLERDLVRTIAQKIAGKKMVHDELEYPQSDKPANNN